MRIQALLMALFIAPLLSGCDLSGLVPGAHAEAQNVRPVVTLQVSPLQGDYQLMAGNVAPRLSSQIGFSVSGRLIARDVSIGDIVAAGDAIARIDPYPLALALEMAEAEKRMAEAELTNADAALARRTALQASGTISDAVLDLARLHQQSASARLDAANAGLSQARTMLDDATLFAPFHGIVTAVHVETGETIAGGMPIVTLAGLDARDAIIDVPEVLAPTVSVGDAWTILLEAAPDYRASGVIREIAPQADSATRTQRVRIALENPDEAFRLGTTVFAHPAEIAGAALFALPASAVFEKDGKDQVWVVDPASTTVGVRAVEVGDRVNGGRIIRSGLASGDIVVTAGVNSLVEGQAVRLLEE